MRLRRGLLAGIVALLLGTGTWLWLAPEHKTASNTPQVTATNLIMEFRFQQFESIFNSNNVAAQATLIVPGLQSAFLNQNRRQSRPDIKLDRNTLLVHGNYAQILAESKNLSYIVRLVSIDNQWYIVETEIKR